MGPNPLLEAHEEATRAHDPFISRVSITVAVLAVTAAGAGSLETLESGAAITESSRAVLAQEKAADAWTEYQADSLKRHMYDIAAENGGPSHFRKDSEDQVAAQQKAREEADEAEKERDAHLAAGARHEERHHWLAAGTTLIEIGIALSSMAIITRRRPFWFTAMGLGALGIALFGAAYL